MRISARCDYACRALLELSLHWPNKEPVQIHTISQKQDIPVRYLVHILIQLKQMGLVDSLRGKEGGYVLVKPPNIISLGEIMRKIQGPLLSLAKSSKNSKSIFPAIWQDLEVAMAKVLDKLTFEDVCNKLKKMDKAVLYQI